MASFTSTQAFAARVDVLVPSQSRRGHLLHNHCLKIQALNIRNDEFADKSSSRSMVDSNLTVLRNRVNEVKVKERLERCLLPAVNDRDHHHPQQQRPAGWNYLPAATISDYRQQKKLKKKKNGLELTEVALRVSTTFGGTLLTGTLSLYLLSVFLHLNH